MEEVVADEDCNNDHSTDLPLDRTHAHEDTDSMEEVGGGAYDNLRTDRTDARSVVGVGLLHNHNRHTVGAVEVPATIQPIHDFVS